MDTTKPHAEATATTRETARRPLLVIAALVLAQFAAADGITGIYVMMPSFYREFAQDNAAISWIVSIYFLVGAVSAALGGRLADLLGRKRVAVIILVIASVGAFLSAGADTVAGLIAGASLLGCAMTLTPILIGMAREHLGAARTALGIGAIAAAGTAGSGLVYLLVGSVVDAYGRVGGYVAMALLLLVSAVALAMATPRSELTKSVVKIDFVRGCLFAPAVAGLMLAIELGGVQHWREASAPALLVASLLLAAYWARTQLKAVQPLIDLRLMAHAQLLRAMGAIFFFGIAGVQVGQMLSLLLQQPAGSGVGFSFAAGAVGLFMLPINSLATLVSPFGGYLAHRVSARFVVVMGGALMAIGWLWLSLGLSDFKVVIAAAVTVTVGLALFQPGNYMMIVEATPLEHTSGAAGLSYTLFNIGFAAGAQIVLGVLMSGATGAPSADAYHRAFLWLALGSAPIALMGLLGSGLFPARRIVGA